MVWEVVVAALGGSAITGIVGYFANSRSLKAASERSNSEIQARMEQIRLEQQHQLYQEVIQRRLDFRRDRLLPLQDLLGRLVNISGRYQSTANAVIMSQIGVDEQIFIGEEEFQEIARDIDRFRREELGLRPWWEVADSELTELVNKLNQELRALEKYVGEYADFLDSSKTTKEKADKARESIDNTLQRIAKRVEELVSGVDLLDS